MLNLKDVTGVESSPISKSILENSLGNNILKDSRAYANYEFLLSSIQNGAFKAPSVIFASGDGTFYPKNTAYQGDFYSANILARDGYTNSWMTSYGTDESFNLSYYDGSRLFKSLNIDPSTGKGKIRSLEVRNGNLPGQAGFVQFLLGYNESASTNDNGKYRHNFRTRHSTTSNSENSIDIFLWDYVNDSANAVGSRRVLSLYGTGSIEIVSGTEIFGPVSIAITTSAEKTIEQNTLAQSGKGVIYYNQNQNRFRYSENGGPFKYLGSGGGAGIETCSFNTTAPYRKLEPNESIHVIKYAAVDIVIKSLTLQMFPNNSGNNQLGIAVYKGHYDGPDSNYASYQRVWNYAGSISSARYANWMVKLNTDPIEIPANTPYMIVIYNYNTHSNFMPQFAASINLAASLFDFQGSADNAMQSSCTDYSSLGTTLYLSELDPNSIVPYILVGVE